MEAPSTGTWSVRDTGWRLPLLLGLVLAGIIFFRGRGVPDTEREPDTARLPSESDDSLAHGTVSLAIDFGASKRLEFDNLPWHERITVAELLGRTTGVNVRQTGIGAAAFLTAINGVANQGADGRNWTYEVNGQGADRSFALYELRPGDRVLWTFGPPR